MEHKVCTHVYAYVTGGKMGTLEWKVAGVEEYETGYRMFRHLFKY